MATVRVKIVPNRKGIRNYLKDSRGDQGMINTLGDVANQLARTAGHGFVAKQMMRRKNRPGFIVYAKYAFSQELQAREGRLQGAVLGMSRPTVIPGLR